MSTRNNHVQGSLSSHPLAAIALSVLALFLLTACGESAEVAQADKAEETAEVAGVSDDAVEDATSDMEPATESAVTATEETNTGTEASTDAAVTAPYRVECDRDDEGRLSNCKVDQDTFVGWRTFGGSCAQCHGENATGSSFAPNLIAMIEGGMDVDKFLTILREGRAGGAMPAFKENPNVWDNAEGIYGYLKARADGELTPGRPGRIGR